MTRLLTDEERLLLLLDDFDNLYLESCELVIERIIRAPEGDESFLLLENLFLDAIDKQMSFSSNRLTEADIFKSWFVETRENVSLNHFFTLADYMTLKHRVKRSEFAKRLRMLFSSRILEPHFYYLYLVWSKKHFLLEKVPVELFLSSPVFLDKKQLYRTAFVLNFLLRTNNPQSLKLGSGLIFSDVWYFARLGAFCMMQSYSFTFQEKATIALFLYEKFRDELKDPREDLKFFLFRLFTFLQYEDMESAGKSELELIASFALRFQTQKDISSVYSTLNYKTEEELISFLRLVAGPIDQDLVLLKVRLSTFKLDSSNLDYFVNNQIREAIQRLL